MDLATLYQDIVETSPDGIWVIGLDGRTVYANPEIARIHRVPLGALSALTVFDTLDEAGKTQFAAHLEGVKAGRVNNDTVEVQWVRSDGDIAWMLCSETVLHDEEGRLAALLHRYSDFSGRRALIDSLRASEEALEDQVAQNNLMQAVASAANEATSLTEVLLHARDLVLLHDDWERARAFVPEDGTMVPFYPVDSDRIEDEGDPRAAADLALAQRSLECRGLVWDDRRLTVAFPVLLGEDVYAVVVITSAPPLYRYELIETMVVGVAEQLTRVAERERAQAEVALARDEAMEASRQKSDFLATMSHEIRTPLNGVIGLNDLLMRTTLTPEQQRLTSGVQVASRALLGLINDILDFSKIEAGRLELEILDFEVRPLLEQVAGMLTEAARDKGLDLVISCHHDVPAVLAGDPTRLAQVLTNLVSNAVKFTERGGVVVRATVEPGGPGVQLRLAVSDTGIGIATDKLADLFDPFTQADSSTTRIYGGTGLGLAISREIVEAMGGTLEHTANPGGGSVFSFTAEMGRGAELGSGDRSGSNGDDHARRVLAGTRTLVVDDNETSRLMLREQLAWWDLAADIVGTAGEALDLLSAPSQTTGPAYDLVLVDLAVPERDGLDLARQMRAHPGNAPLKLVMLTATVTVDPAGVQEAGIDDLITKPVLSSVLRDSLVRVVSGDDAPMTATQQAPAPTKGRVLVVEDNRVNQMVAQGLLKALGYASVTVDDGLAAIEAVRAGSYEAILMDVQMPVMDGYAATRHIRSDPSVTQVPIIAMTAAAVEGERERCLAAGMDDFLTKPVDPARLGETLERWLTGGSTTPAPTRRVAPDLESSRQLAPKASARLDLKRLTELRRLDDAGDKRSYLDRAIENFMANSRQEFLALATALESGDDEQLGAAAHKLAGSALNLGAAEAGQAAQAIEHDAADGTLTDGPSRISELEELLNLDLEALRAYQQQYYPRRAS